MSEGSWRFERVQELQGHEDRAWCVAWSADGSLLASCSGDRSIRIWDAASWRCLCNLTDAHEKAVRRLAWHPRLQRLAAAAFDGRVSVWEPETALLDGWMCAATLEGHESEVKSIAWDSTGQLLATCGRDKSVWVWSTDAETAREYDCISVLRGHSGDVKCVAWAAEEPVLFSASYDNTLREWRAAGDDWACSQTLEAHASTVWHVAPEPRRPEMKNALRLASCSDDSRAIVWSRSAETGQWMAAQSLKAAEPGRPVYGVAWAPLSARGMLATASGDNTLRLFGEGATASAEWIELANITVGMSDINCVAWNPVQADILATASDDGIIRVWHVAQK